MSLSEGKMFTIEALNRIEGFAWPEDAKFAAASLGEKVIGFYKQKPLALTVGFDLQYAIYDVGEQCLQYLPDQHPDWRNSLITRGEFESVDGWVRYDCNPKCLPPLSPSSIVGVKTSEGVESFGEAIMYAWSRSGGPDAISAWRYHKPQKQEVKPEPGSNASNQSESQEGIESLISKHKAVKEIARLARIELERAEAAEHSLMLSIEAWAESHGFDIRVLSEIGNAVFDDGVLSIIEYPAGFHIPNPVITDWRDLQVGDVVSWSALGFECECEVTKLPIYTASGEPYIAIMAENQITYGAYLDEIKFIRRPEKK